MPRAPKVCSDPYCPNLQPCPEHTPKPWASSRRNKRPGRSGSREQKLNRAVMLHHDAICHVCGEGGADEVDHVIPLSQGGGDGMDNRRPIHSTPCHKEKTQREAREARL